MSSTYTVTRDQIISLALRKLGVLEIGDTPMQIQLLMLLCL